MLNHRLRALPPHLQHSLPPATWRERGEPVPVRLIKAPEVALTQEQRQRCQRVADQALTIHIETLGVRL